jgi:hypothetical protein
MVKIFVLFVVRIKFLDILKTSFGLNGLTDTSVQLSFSTIYMQVYAHSCCSSQYNLLNPSRLQLTCLSKLVVFLFCSVIDRACRVLSH